MSGPLNPHLYPRLQYLVGSSSNTFPVSPAATQSDASRRRRRRRHQHIGDFFLQKGRALSRLYLFAY